MPTSYIIREPKAYRLNDAPIEESPSERLTQNGPASLSVQELLSTSIGESPSILDHVQEYGIHSLTALHSVEEITYTLGIPSEEAVRLLAALELGRRLFGKSLGSLIKIQGIEDVFQHYRSMTLLPKEQLRALLINSRFQVVHEEVLGVGSIESLHIQPRDIFQAAVERRVTALILVHNHPSGDASPSTADYEFTAQALRAAEILGIQILDHVIVAEGGYSSCLPKEAL